MNHINWDELYKSFPMRLYGYWGDGSGSTTWSNALTESHVLSSDALDAMRYGMMDTIHGKFNNRYSHKNPPMANVFQTLITDDFKKFIDAGLVDANGDATPALWNLLCEEFFKSNRALLLVKADEIVAARNAKKSA